MPPLSERIRIRDEHLAKLKADNAKAAAEYAEKRKNTDPTMVPPDYSDSSKYYGD